MDSSPPVSESQIHQQSQQQSAGPSGGPQIRSRITVVCAECKRLKLKCDRRNPCGSCTKRDTVARCIYSAAAAEKVDLHSLNNRLIQVESQVAQMTAPGSRSYSHSFSSFGPSSQSDRPILAVGSSGSSLAISLDDISAIWLDELKLNKDVLPSQPQPAQSSCTPYANPSQVKLEPLPVSLPVSDVSNGPELPLPLLLPPLSAYYISPSPSPYEAPSVTLRLVQHLPFAQRKRQKLYDNVEDVLKMRPSFNLKHFKDRAEGMFRWASEAEGTEALPDCGSSGQGGSRPSTSAGLSTITKAETARAIFFGPPPDPPPASRGPPPPKPTLSFFAVVAAAFALGTLVDREAADEVDGRSYDINGHGDRMAVDDASSSGRPSSRKRTETPSVIAKKPKGISKDAASYPAVLYALSQQALCVFEKSNSYDLDYLAAMILHVLYVLHDGKARVAHNLLPDVGKMVNTARTMGLDSDPDEYPGKFNLFEAEMRRRIWWDIYYYDLIVSDFMGRSPLIPDHEFTTRLPMDVDEEVFTPACTSMPLPRSPLSPLEPSPTDFKYFGLKCRLAQLVKSIKMRSFKDPQPYDPSASDQFSLEQAASCENEVKQWLADLPPAFRLDMDAGLPNTCSSDAADRSVSSLSSNDTAAVSPVLVAQRCELAVTANRLILKIYLPFLRPSYAHGSSATHYQATIGTISAAHVIIHASNVLYSMWKQRPDLKCRRPSPGLFDFYSFGRTLFDAAVVCAHNAIKQPTSMWQRVAMDDVNIALEVMRDPVVVTGRGSMRGGVEGGVNEAVKIVELMKKKAEAARSGDRDLSAAGMKRKHDEVEVDTDQFMTKFYVPFIGGDVAVGPSAPVATPPAPQRPQTPSVAPAVATPNPVISEHANEAPKRTVSTAANQPGGVKRGPSASTDTKSKEKHGKKTPYPAVGIRVRPDKASPLWSRSRTTPSSEYDLATQGVTPAPSRTPSHASTPTSDPRSYHQQSSSQDSSSPYPPSSLTASSPIDGRAPPATPKERPITAIADHSLPFGAADQASSIKVAGRYGNSDINTDSHSQQYANLTPPQSTPMFEQSQPQPFENVSSYGRTINNGTGGHYVNTSPAYSATGPPSYPTHVPSHDPRSTSLYRDPSSSHPYYPSYTQYAGPLDSENTLAGMGSSMRIDSGGDGGNGTINLDGRDAMYGYPSNKTQAGMYILDSTDHRSSTQHPYSEQISPPTDQVSQWPLQANAAVHNDGAYWGQQYNHYAS